MLETKFHTHIKQHALFFSVPHQPSYGLCCLTVEDSRTHTHSVDSSQVGDHRHRDRRLHNTQQTQQRNIHAFSGIRTPNLNSRVSEDIRLRPHGHRVRQCTIIVLYVLIFMLRNNNRKTNYLHSKPFPHYS
jgi:hypothetical protein